MRGSHSRTGCHNRLEQLLAGADRVAIESLFLRQPDEGCGRINHRERGIGVAAWITCHKGVAAAGFGRRRADGIFEIRPRQRECPSDDVVIDRSDGEDANESRETEVPRAAA